MNSSLNFDVYRHHFILYHLHFETRFQKKKHFETLIVSEKICEKFIDLMSSKLLMRIMRKFVDTNFCAITFTITLI